jgi:hypothetical protein
VVELRHTHSKKRRKAEVFLQPPLGINTTEAAALLSIHSALTLLCSITSQRIDFMPSLNIARKAFAQTQPVYDFKAPFFPRFPHSELAPKKKKLQTVGHSLIVQAGGNLAPFW